MINILFVVQILLIIFFTLQLYLWVKGKKKRSSETETDFCFLIKRWWAEYCIKAKRRHAQYLHNSKQNVPVSLKILHEDNGNSVLFYGADQNGNSFFIQFSYRKSKLAEISLQLITSDGQQYVLPDYPDATVITGLNQEWTGGGLKIEFLEARKRWRVVYNGMLRNLARGEQCSDDSIEHVRLNFLFICNSYTLRWPEDWSPKVHAETLARESWNNFKWINKIKLFDNKGFDVTGSMLGQITYKDASVTSLYLRGVHQHRWGKHEFEESVTLFAVTPYGHIFYVGVGTTEHSFKQIQFGQFKHSDNEIYDIDEMDLKLSSFNQEEFSVNSTYKIRFKAKNEVYNIVVKVNDPITVYYGQPWNRMNKIASVKLEVNGKSATGLIQKWAPYNGPCRTKVPKQLKLLKQPNMSVQKDDYILYFNDEKCQNESIVGGKGYSLAVLTSIQDGNFVVPKGFCVTVFGLELQLNTYKELQKIIDEIENVSAGRKNGDLQAYCEQAIKIIESTPVVDKLKNIILKAIENLESADDDKSPRYAIRSSAVGEDSEETSAAGQNATYLGIRGADNIIKSVAMCWASLFSYQSVKYRKQHGLHTRAPMGVCVQRMVNPDAAGVMFTRHPTTGDPSNILITANYGLGETVVSATVEPDTIVVHRSWDNKLTVRSSTVGNKKEKILTSGDGVITVKLNDQESKIICLSDDVALRLAAVGVNLEKLFGSGRDVEWAVIGEQIYLLQARPITTLYTWSEFELIHELGTGVPSDIDLITFANVGEVLPYPMSPLAISVLTPALTEDMNVRRKAINQECFAIVGMKCGINYYDTFLGNPAKEITLLNKMIDIALSGQIVTTPERHKIACERNGVITPGFQLYLTWILIKEIIQIGSVVKTATKTLKSLNLKVENFQSARSLYDEIQNYGISNTLQIIVNSHSQSSTVSISFQSLAMMLLTSGYTDIVPDHFSDVGVLFSSCNDIVGAEVLLYLKKIITHIKNHKKDEEFKKVEAAKGVEWLKINCPSAAEELDNFLEEHGHRCIQEMDFISEPWSLRPENLISALQTMMAGPELKDSSKALSVEETVALLKTPKSAFTKWLLKKITPFCRKAVMRRELTKSLLVRTIHKLRLAYRKLAKLMVSEEYLPSEDLIFFLTNEEIDEILNHRNSALIQKAYRRKRIFPKLKEFEYPELNVGMLMPIEKNLDVPIFDGSIKIEGTSVYGGSIVARACVITNIAEAYQIRHGDILITHCTDIAWSPYFSLLSGIVTELGGLISHGAVIAREYGLSCIIAAKNATQLFKTGDTVLLAADAGYLQLVKRHETEEKKDE